MLDLKANWLSNNGNGINLKPTPLIGPKNIVSDCCEFFEYCCRSWVLLILFPEDLEFFFCLDKAPKLPPVLLV